MSLLCKVAWDPSQLTDGWFSLFQDLYWSCAEDAASFRFGHYSTVSCPNALQVNNKHSPRSMLRLALVTSGKRGGFLLSLLLLFLNLENT